MTLNKTQRATARRLEQAACADTIEDALIEFSNQLRVVLPAFANPTAKHLEYPELEAAWEAVWDLVEANQEKVEPTGLDKAQIANAQEHEREMNRGRVVGQQRSRL